MGWVADGGFSRDSAADWWLLAMGTGRNIEAPKANGEAIS